MKEHLGNEISVERFENGGILLTVEHVGDSIWLTPDQILVLLDFIKRSDPLRSVYILNEPGEVERVGLGRDLPLKMRVDKDGNPIWLEPPPPPDLSKL